MCGEIDLDGGSDNDSEDAAISDEEFAFTQKQRDVRQLDLLDPIEDTCIYLNQ